jgi:hypothetical protein
MRPAADELLGMMAQTLLVELAPALPDEYRQRGAQLLGMLLLMAVEEWDRTADRLVEENREVRRLFREAMALLGPSLRERVAREAEAESGPGSLRLRHLQEQNDRLRALLIDVHAALEEQPETAARKRVDDAIWEELRASTRRRALSAAPF